MGYQESLVQFQSIECLKSELRQYNKKDKSHDLAQVVCVDRVKKNVDSFTVGDLLAVVCGERSAQRSNECLEFGLGLKNVKSITYIDKFYDCTNDLTSFLDGHFERLSDTEYEALIQ